MVRLVEFASWALFLLLGVAFLAEGGAALSIPYLLLLFLAIFLRFSIRVVKEYDRLVVFRVGRCIGAKGPGAILVLPFMDSVISVDTREQYREIPHESCITKDNARIDVDFLFYYKIRDPELQVTRVQNLQEALGGLATGLLRAVIGDISLDEALAEREHINLQLREKIDEITERWGVEVTTVEIREIVIPHETQEVMSREMAAERSRRAMILEAQGYREAQLLRAEGDAHALAKLDETARHIDPNTINLRYLEMLRHMGETSATKFILPLELTSLVRSIAAALDQSGEHREIAVDPQDAIGQLPPASLELSGEPPPTAPGNGKPSAEVQVDDSDS